MQQVPNQEMTDVMRVRSSANKKALTRGSWVRLKRNDEYKDDLAQVCGPTLFPLPRMAGEPTLSPPA